MWLERGGEWDKCGEVLTSLLSACSTSMKTFGFIKVTDIQKHTAKSFVPFRIRSGGQLHLVPSPEPTLMAPAASNFLQQKKYNFAVSFVHTTSNPSQRIKLIKSS